MRFSKCKPRFPASFKGAVQLNLCTPRLQKQTNLVVRHKQLKRTKHLKQNKLETALLSSLLELTEDIVLDPKEHKRGAREREIMETILEAE